MRLTDHDIQIIQSTFREKFGVDDRLWLFGSRADDSKRGGDIDFYIETMEPNLDIAINKKLEFVVKLIMLLGDQKIDVVLNIIHDKKDLPIYRIAKETGIQIL